MERLKPIWEWFLRYWKKFHMTQITILLSLSAILITIVYFAFLASQANVQTLQEGLKQSTVIYDRNGEVATKINTNRTTGVEIEAIPDHVQQAVIAIEDHRFYEHNGFDLIGITRAFFKNLLAGRITGGGSTITQQLAKNALLTPEQTIKRKLQELFLALEIEKVYSKDEILEMYLNQSYFGNGAYGIDQAARKYFNKNVNELSLNEGAMLAGLLQSPSALDPTKNYEGAVKRKNVVLHAMHENGFITDEQLKVAKEEDVQLEEGEGNFIERKYPYYVDAVLDEAINTYGLTQEEILTRGYKIYTEMDQNLQVMMEEVYSRDSMFPTGRGGEIVQSGSVLLDAKSGGVLALVGGRGEPVFRGFNRATHLKAQPGSTLKPLAVYTPALEEGYKYTSPLVDELKTYKDYTPTNPDNQYRGEVPLYEAVEKSINAPTVWLLNEIGLEKGIDSLKRFGIPLEEEDHYLGIGLGGMHKGISPLKLAEAYTAFPNEGKRKKGHLITKIVGPTGKTIAEFEGKSTKVTSATVAKEMTSLLLNVVESGTGKGTQIEGVDIAGKTGSTQLPYEDLNGTKDQWFVGYTPNLVGAVWLGYDKTDREHYITSSSADTVVPLFREIMKGAIAHVDPGEFYVNSVNARLDGAKLERSKIAFDMDEIIERADQLEEKISEESSKFKQVLDEVKQDAKFVKEKLDSAIDLLRSRLE